MSVSLAWVSVFYAFVSNVLINQQRQSILTYLPAAVWADMYLNVSSFRISSAAVGTLLGLL